MTTWFNAILGGINVYAILAVMLFIPIEVYNIFNSKKMNIFKSVVNQMFLLYIICLIAVCFFPLPSAKEAMSLVTRFQGIPFWCIVDIIKNPCVASVFQIIFNVLLTIPFGAFIKFRTNVNTRVVVLASLLLSLVIEFVQLTGLLFIYQGSYRVCDVDDLILNTLGGFIGAVLVLKYKEVLPDINKYERKINMNKPVLV